MIIEQYLNYIQEGYLFSDKTISIDLDKFESGKSKKLIIVGLSGAGKSTLSAYLSKKYKCGVNELDVCCRTTMTDAEHEYFMGNMISASDPKLFKKFYNLCFKPALLTNKKEVVEGAIFQAYNMFPSSQSLINKFPVIIIGKSAAKASWDRTQRSLRREKHKNATLKDKLKKFKIGAELNFKFLEKHLSQFRKTRMKAGGEIKEFKIPTLMGVTKK